jgi:hypothetical protein
MEPNQPGNQGNWNQPSFQTTKDLPGATASMVLGIVALVFSTVVNCCYFIGIFPGLIMSIIGLILGGKASRLYNADPNLYSIKSFKQAKAGKIMNLIALIICGVLTLLLIVAIAVGSFNEINKYNSFDNFD